MIHVDFDPQKLDGELKIWWDDWSEKAKAATDNIILTWINNGSIKDSDFNTDIWGALKNWFLENIFNGKCAYCETKINRFYPDAEHFRPKAKVLYKTKEGKSIIPKVKDSNGQLIDHPGYFWLAYNWENLLPSCKLCNAGKGKLNQFPTEDQLYEFAVKLTDDEVKTLSCPPHHLTNWKNYYLLDCKDLDIREKRTLLHPVFDNPELHLKFGVRGTIAPLTSHGEDSIAAYNLLDDSLRDARQKVQQMALLRYWNQIFFEEMENLNGAEDTKVAKERAANRAILQIKEHKKDAYLKAQCDYMLALVV